MKNVMRYRKKPVEVEAVRFEGGPDDALEVIKWIQAGGGRASYETVDMDTIHGMIGIQTLEGRMHATPGDYIIRGVQGEFYPCKPGIFEQTYEMPLYLNGKNRVLLESAWDDGDGNTITIEPTEDWPWFRGTYDGHEVMLGMEHDGTIYSIVYASGGGLVSVIVGNGLINNEVGVVFRNVGEAKAYVKGITSR